MKARINPLIIITHYFSSPLMCFCDLQHIHLVSVILTAQQQTDAVSNYLVNVVEHLAAVEPDISLMRW